ncbi:hypothetical protein C5B42_00535 [Candidatus Cerribacteria bacterium 'Amazon FNV 2010 28 9']|uniref:Uncharacterized protein n=1 Tax=Candidatus Cerribacteria bacterium 'Amazon FNV 2010 28 9' TaxID=2081795 RepID=A0A317JRG3_9BACT|nr:MAG: hypothetical protein C5B42_00535 [Candidatus Cerribacteria bacterium 'Amazon FNV 2010 28 9']
MANKNTKHQFIWIALGGIIFLCLFIAYLSLTHGKTTQILLSPAPLSTVNSQQNTQMNSCNTIEYYANLIDQSFKNPPSRLATSPGVYMDWKNATASRFIKEQASLLVEAAIKNNSASDTNTIYLSTLEKDFINSGFSKNLLNTVISASKQSYRYGYEKGSVKIVAEFNEDEKVPNSQTFDLFCGVIN